jgi:drug/metabolite transporter (DMT)-like permease
LETRPPPVRPIPARTLWPNRTSMVNSGIAAALGAALLFGASTPFAKLLLGDLPPLLLAGLLYGGSGLGLGAWLLFRPDAPGAGQARLSARDYPWLAGAVLFGGVLGPVLLMLGLARTSAAEASLLLNLEGVFTALLAWFAFRENFDRRIVFGMGLIVAGGAVLVWDPADIAWSPPALLIAGACLCWALDNNLTRKIALRDPVAIAAIKGGVAGTVNLSAALVLGAALPALPPAAAAAALGLAGYGVSLVLFVIALRHLGTARSSAYFSTAPFIGAALSFALLAESPDWRFWCASALMALGVILHLTERHEHRHEHEPLAHEHAHVHDDHHRHEHAFEWDGHEPHVHAHRHPPIIHSHPHYPDTHHRHPH